MDNITIGTLTLGLFTFLFLIAYLIVGIFTLIYQGKRNQWVWFILTLIFNIVLLIYWIVWYIEYPKLKKKNRK